MPAKRLSTAFDSVTLYGCDPDERPDIYGKVGNSGVSIATLDDMKVLYAGFDLCAPDTSVSMTINGPAPTILAMFLNTAIDQQLDKFRADNGREPTDDEAREDRARGRSPTVRGTVQADILKEDQGQNTCIFSTEFALKVMGDIQEYFVAPRGAQLLLGVDLRLPHRRGRGEPDLASSPSRWPTASPTSRPTWRAACTSTTSRPTCRSSSRNGMDPEYTVIGRVARRIWAVAMRDRYGANERSQKLKYHIQTSRPLAARAGDGLQRHPHHAAGADRHLRQLQHPAHQRLRRGDHHADRGIGAPRDGDPADHQPRMGPGEEREPATRARSSSRS